MNYNLKVNVGKTERYTIPRPQPISPSPPIEQQLIDFKNSGHWYSDLDWLVKYEAKIVRKITN